MITYYNQIDTLRNNLGKMTWRFASNYSKYALIIICIYHARLLVFSVVAMSMSGIAVVLSPNIWIYASMRFVCGFARATVGTCAMVLSTEIVGKKWRDFVSIFSFVCFTMGFLSLPMIAYLCRMMSWRVLYLWTSVPSLCYAILVHFLVQESPRFVKQLVALFILFLDWSKHLLYWTISLLELN